jgi:hypothetical protein
MVQINSGIVSWVITGFAPTSVNSLIKIFGKIDMPATSGLIGTGKIITYSDRNIANIYKNGSIIDYFSGTFPFSTSNSKSFNANPEITLL